MRNFDTPRGAGIIPVYFGVGDTRILLVRGKHSGKWSFPKGYRENNEFLEETAVREMKEETGIQIQRHQISKNTLKFVNYKFWFVKFEKMLDVKIQVSEILEYKWFKLSEMKEIKINRDIRAACVGMFFYGFDRSIYPYVSFIRQNERKFNVKVKEFVPILEPSS